MNFRGAVNFGETTLKKVEDQKVKKAEAQKAQAQGRMMTRPVVFESATLCVHSELLTSPLSVAKEFKVETNQSDHAIVMS